MPKSPKRKKRRGRRRAASRPSPEVAAVAAELGVPLNEAERLVGLIDATGALGAKGPCTWTVGLRPLPIPLDDHDDPALLVWTEGPLVVAVGIVDRDVTHEQLADAYQAACREPQHGRPRAPEVVRVESERLANLLRQMAGEDVELEVGPPGQLFEDACEHLLEMLVASDAPNEASPDFIEGLVGWLAEQDDATNERLAKLSHLLLAQRPWERCRPDEGIAVYAPALDLEPGWLTVMGHNGQHHGFRLHRSQTAFELEDAEWTRFENGAELSSLRCPPVWSFELVRGQMPDGVVAVLPAPCVQRDQTMGFVPTRDDLELIVAASEAVLVSMAAEPERFDRAWTRGGPVFEGSCEIDLARGPIAVTVKAPGTENRATYH